MARRRTAIPQRIKIGDHLRRSDLKRRVSVVVGLLLFSAIVFADRSGWLLHQSAQWRDFDGRTFRVVRVIDGDTLDIDMPSGKFASTRIRLWGVDAPETAKPREGTEAEPFADEAWALARLTCEGKPVTLRLEPHELRDRYDRLLAHVELPDGSVLNEVLLLEGLARTTPRFPHGRSERYELLEKQAKFEKKGMWRK